MGEVVPLRREYTPRPVRFRTDEGYLVTVSGTLEGSIDFCIETRSGSTTYVLTPDDTHPLTAALHDVNTDIQANCLFDRDPRLHNREVR